MYVFFHSKPKSTLCLLFEAPFVCGLFIHRGRQSQMGLVSLTGGAPCWSDDVTNVTEIARSFPSCESRKKLGQVFTGYIFRKQNRKGAGFETKRISEIYDDIHLEKYQVKVSIVVFVFLLGGVFVPLPKKLELYFCTLLETNSSPLKIGRAPKCYVSFMECISLVFQIPCEDRCLDPLGVWTHFHTSWEGL